MPELNIVFLSGLSGSGKGWFWTNILKPTENYYKLKSDTTRKPRKGEVSAKSGGDYYFMEDEADFNKVRHATNLFVNEPQWKEIEVRKNKLKKFLPDALVDKYKPNPKWLYGVPDFELKKHKDKILVYDVIQPMYIREMIDYCEKSGYKVNAKILWFQPPKNNFEIAKKRATMKKQDLSVRTRNTCNLTDFWEVNLHPDFTLLSSENRIQYPVDMVESMDMLPEVQNLGLAIEQIHNEMFFVKKK